MTLLASALAEDERAAETFSRLKRVAREGLRDAAGRLRACAARNAWAAEAFRGAGVDAALAAGIFHRKEVCISGVKAHLLGEGFAVREA